MFHNSPYCFLGSCRPKDFEGSSAPCVERIVFSPSVGLLFRQCPLQLLVTRTELFHPQDADGWSDLLSSTLTCQFSFDVAASAPAELIQQRQVLPQCAMMHHGSHKSLNQGAQAQLSAKYTWQRALFRKLCKQHVRNKKECGFVQNGIAVCRPQNGKFNGKKKWKNDDDNRCQLGVSHFQRNPCAPFSNQGRRQCREERHMRARKSLAPGPHWSCPGTR